jgi:hypothetical protein
VNLKTDGMRLCNEKKRKKQNEEKQGPREIEDIAEPINIFIIRVIEIENTEKDAEKILKETSE